VTIAAFLTILDLSPAWLQLKCNRCVTWLGYTSSIQKRCNTRFLLVYGIFDF
jgi:hypothetical protein